MTSLPIFDTPVASYKRTKIIATIGPSTSTPELIHGIIAAGANGLRLNFSHGTHEEREEQIPWIREASASIGKPVAIIQDLQGPKVRLGDFDGGIDVHTGENIVLEYESDYAATGHIPVQYDLSKKVQPGERIYLYDGKVHGIIENVEGSLVHVKIENDGTLLKRKGLNLPDTDFQGDILTEKDLKDIAFGAKHDLDYVALSFVQTAADIENLRKILQSHGSDARIIAKIETKAAVDNIEDILRVSDAIMVARGDLAVETPAESVPVVQREIIGLGQKYAKPTIVATQMMLSMMEMPDPTRAEVSDVATAVFTGADCVMLSDETANGKYPVRTVETMKRVILYAEQHSILSVVNTYGHEEGRPNAIAASALTLAEKLKAKAIVAETRSGATALRISSLRPRVPIMAVTHDQRTAQQLSLIYGVKSFVQPPELDAAETVIRSFQTKTAIASGDTVVSISGRTPGSSGNTDTIRVQTIQ